jgi:hypothetical protein
MTPNDDFSERRDHGAWRPPRPKYSNVSVSGTTERWFEFEDNSTEQIKGPSLRDMTHYKTYSFYHHQGKKWIYPSDATQYQVGDGSGNNIMSGRDPHRVYGGSDSSESDFEESSWEDWTELTFQWLDPSQTIGGVSLASLRNAENQLFTQRADQKALLELIPPRYHAEQRRWTENTAYGGLIGELPILIALVAYSVPPKQVRSRMPDCFRLPHRSHGLRRPSECKLQHPNTE